MKEFQERLDSCAYIFLDTMIFSYHLGEHARYLPLTRAVLASVESGVVRAVTTTVSAAELLVPAARAGDGETFYACYLYITSFPNLTIMPLDLDLAREAALVRGSTGLRMPDAVQVAAALTAGVDAIVTNDGSWRGKVDDVEILLLEDYASPGP